MYVVDVIESPAGEATATFQLEPRELIESLGELQETLLASSVPSRRLISRGESRVREVGQRLFDALFADASVGGVYRASCAVAAERGDSLRIVLRIGAPELAALPWESVFDAATESFVSRREPLVRFVPVPSSPPPLKVQLPLRILALIASPRGLAQLDVEKERENLTAALRSQIDRGAIVVEWLEHASWPALQDALLADSWHVVHFIGHGDFDIERDEGVLALETEAGRLHRVPAEHFVDLLREARPMPRLVVLNACESATSGETDLFSGAAAALVRGGVCAVTAMQFEISDQAAIAFSRGFYTAIGRGRGVDEAVRSGRVAILGLGEGSLEWITPTLYLRGRENRLFVLSDSPLPRAPEPVVAEQRDRAAAAAEVGDPATAVPLFDSVLAETPDDETVRHDREQAVTAARGPETVPEAPPAGEYPNRLEEMLAAVKRVPWSNRASTGDLEPLAEALRPDEQIIGCTRLAFSLAQACALVVTDQHVHAGTSTPGAGGWTALCGRLPTEYSVSPDRLRIPLDDIERAEVDGDKPVLVIRERGRVSLGGIFGSGNDATLLQGYVTEALTTTRPETAPDAPSADAYPNRFEELWAVAKGVPWTRRASKANLRPLAEALHPDEQIVGVTRLVFTFSTAAALVVTDDAVHIGTSAPSESGWTEMCSRLAQEYRRSPDRLRVPLDDVEASAVEDNHPVLVMREQGRVALATYRSENEAKLIQGFVTQAVEKRRR